MVCIHCGQLCDYVPGLTCKGCLEKIEAANYRVYILGLLKKAKQHCPLQLQLEIEALLGEKVLVGVRSHP